MIAAENWCVKFDDKVYGPYTSDQMRKFAQEGRLAAWSLISPAGSRAWREACKESTFDGLFDFNNTAMQKPGEKTFGKENPNKGKSKTKANRISFTSVSENPAKAANFIVIFDADRGSANRVEAAMYSLGPAFRLTANVWSVTCELTAIGVRNAIAPYLTPSEPIFVVDATRGRATWQNHSLESQARINAVFL